MRGRRRRWRKIYKWWGGGTRKGEEARVVREVMAVVMKEK